MNEPSIKQLRQGVREIQRLARLLTHARQAASPDQVEHLASLEKLACRVQRNLDSYLERLIYHSVRPLRSLKETRRCFRNKLPLPGEPLQWHLPTTIYDFCYVCRRRTIEKAGLRRRFCTSCGEYWRLPREVKYWKRLKLRARKPKRLFEDALLLCSFPGCYWDRYQGEWCDFHGNQIRKVRELTPNPKSRKTCEEPHCRRSCTPRRDYCGIHPSKKSRGIHPSKKNHSIRGGEINEPAS